MTTLKARLAVVTTLMQRARIDRLLLIGNGHHMIDLDNPVAHMSGYRSVGPAVLSLESDGSARLLTHADEEDAVADFDGDVQLTREICADVAAFAGRGAVAHVGLNHAPRTLAQAILAAGEAPALDAEFYAITAAKTDRELEAARRATAIAEEGYACLLDIVRPGMRECDLAVEVNLFMRARGANDSFLMLNCGPRQDAVMPSSERPIAAGDLLLCELSPSVEGQFTQICRTVSIGPASAIVVEKYPLLVAAMQDGIAHVKPGARLGDVCEAIDNNLSAAGYAQFSRPPFIRRRGHGLGCGSTAPGDVSVDNDARLEAGMLFMVHPNQFLPETGYMMCGEPVVCTDDGFEILTARVAALAQTRG
ncbi:MAG: Xaa-Pro aminopeptidase [Hyphomicrobiales bacterium]|jgi:Xaa-Pro dipeptidase|nr:Xaa-Pro aminopeptidase [Hyphomicrobiales bacterium]